MGRTSGSRKKGDIKNGSKILITDSGVVDPRTLVLDDTNPNQGDVGAISESIAELGFFSRSIVDRRTGKVLIGNHRIKAAIAEGMEEIPVDYIHTDDDAHATRIKIADNRIRDLASTDDRLLIDLLEPLAAAGLLKGTGFDGDDLDNLISDMSGSIEEKYTHKIQAPIYEIQGDQPSITSLYDSTKTESLISSIKSAENLPAEISAFLRLAAMRHTVFFFDKIAEYYAHADKNTQALFEQSALVIIDFEEAIKGGFVTLTKKISEIYTRDYEGEE